MIRFSPARAVKAMLGAGLLALGLTSAAQAAPWKCYTFIPVATDPTFLAHKALAEELSKASGGHIEMNCFLGGSLPIKSNTIVQAVADGVIQFASANPNALQTFVPYAGVLSLPGLFANDAELEKGIAIAAPYIEKALADRGVRLLGWSHFPQAAVFGTTVINGPADLKDLKIRVSTPEQSELIRRLGATPVVISSPEVSSALSTGVIQGVLTSNSGGGRAWKDMFKSTYRLGTNFTPFIYVVNEKAFAALSPEDQKLLTETVAKAASDITTSLVSEDGAILDEFAAGGMQVVMPAEADKDLVANLMRDYWASWAEKQGGDAPAVLAAIRAGIGK